MMEKYLSKRSLIKRTCSGPDKLTLLFRSTFTIYLLISLCLMLITSNFKKVNKR